MGSWFLHYPNALHGSKEEAYGSVGGEDSDCRYGSIGNVGEDDDSSDYHADKTDPVSGLGPATTAIRSNNVDKS